jgi:hypothetical protein
VEVAPPATEAGFFPRWQSGEWVIEAVPEPEPPAPPPPPDSASVNAERDRRVTAGSTFDVAGYGPVRIRGTADDTRNLQALAFAAQLRMAQGDVTHITKFCDDDNVIHDLTPPQILDLWSQGAAYVSAIYAASWVLKDGPDGIPADYADDVHWP